MKKIIFSKHAIEKLDILRKHGLNLKSDIIEKVIKDADHIEHGYKDRLIAQKELDLIHVLRVVFEETESNIKVITFYPGRKDRYEKH